jgi:hypothetical protein
VGFSIIWTLKHQWIAIKTFTVKIQWQFKRIQYLTKLFTELAVMSTSAGKFRWCFMLDPGMLLSSNFKCKLEKLPKKQLFAYEQLGLKSQQTNGSNHHVLMTVELHVPWVACPSNQCANPFSLLQCYPVWIDWRQQLWWRSLVQWVSFRCFMLNITMICPTRDFSLTKGQKKEHKLNKN